ncbi:hypothetical protein D3C77_573200 [compost metagenome]
MFSQLLLQFDLFQVLRLLFLLPDLLRAGFTWARFLESFFYLRPTANCDWPAAVAAHLIFIDRLAQSSDVFGDGPRLSDLSERDKRVHLL